MPLETIKEVCDNDDYDDNKKVARIMNTMMVSYLLSSFLNQEFLPGEEDSLLMQYALARTFRLNKRNGHIACAPKARYHPTLTC